MMCAKSLAMLMCVPLLGSGAVVLAEGVKGTLVWPDEWIVFPDTLDETVAKAGFIYNGGNRIVTNGKAPGEPGYEFRWVAEEYSWQTILTKKGPDPWTGLEISLPVAQEQLDYGSLLMGRLGIGQ